MVNNLEPEEHTIKVYRLGSNSAKYNRTSKKTLVYSKAFDLREDYDMDITVNAGGRVQFSERSTLGNEQSSDNQSSDKTPMTNYDFNQLLQSVKNKWSQALKGETESEAFNNSNNFFSTSQIRQLLTLITSESDRLDLAKLSFRSVTDSANFTQLYDLFKSQSSKDELNDFLRTKGWNIAGQNAVKTPMADAKFNSLLQNVRSKWSQVLKGEMESEAFRNENNFFSTNQVRELLTLISSENDRLDLAKLSYRSVTDTANFTSLYDLFQNQASRNELNTFLRTKGWNISTGPARAPMANNKFSSLLESVRGKWSQALRGEAESEAFNNPNNYFSTSQIMQLLTLIASESDQLDLAKLSYRSVTDSVNFIRLGELFKTQASKEDLNNFLRTKGWNITNNQPAIKTPMADENFNQLLFSVRANLLQFLKVDYERDVFNDPNNYFSTNQVKQLLLLINAEDNRLELAKLSYKTVTDPVNFSQLNTIFTLQSSRDELAGFIKNH
jgi:hypothetical protein